MAEIFWPYNPQIINYGFGSVPGYGGWHNGIDFPVAQGTEIRATASGTVRNNDAGSRDGAGVDIMTSDGWKVRHWHISKFLVPNGSQITAGDVIALSGGQPGTWGAGNATGPHLHWGVAIDGRDGWVDPAGLNPKMFGNIDKEFKDDEVYSKVILSDGSHHVWNMATGQIVGIQSAPDNQRISENMPIYSFSDMNDFQSFANRYPFKFTPQVNVDAIVSAIKDSIQINVDGLAQAIADKIDCGGGVDVTTKAEILEAIELNYPGDK